MNYLLICVYPECASFINNNISRDKAIINYISNIIKNNGNCSYLSIFEHIQNQTEELCLKYVEFIGLGLQYVKDKTEIICRKAINNNKMALKYSNYQTYTPENR